MTNATDVDEWKTRYEQLYEDYTEFQSQSSEIEKELEAQNVHIQEQLNHVTKKAQIIQDKGQDEIRSLQSRLSISQSQIESLKETLSITQSDCERWRNLARQLEHSVEGFETKLRILTAKQETMSEELDDKTELLIMARQEFEEVTNDYAVKQSKQRTLIQSLRIQIEELLEQRNGVDHTDSITITAPNRFAHVPFNLTHLSEELDNEFNEISSPHLSEPSSSHPSNNQLNNHLLHQSVQTAPVSPVNHVSFHRHEHNRYHLGSSTPHSRHSVESDHSSSQILDENKTYSSPRLAEFIQRTDGLQHNHLHTTSHRRVRANSHTHILSVTPTHASLTRSHSRNDIDRSVSPNSYHQRARSSIEPLSPSWSQQPVSPNFHSSTVRPLPFKSPKCNEGNHSSNPCSKHQHEQCNFLSESKQSLEHSQSYTSHGRAPVPR